ncbi:TRAP transporter substrate-binding protein DctP [Derxia gummosa]|uniref:TRAP transporter substrate-binding protein DctP n=1 Tax=Derxia gummosa DSM 723 TaxID=1121388 RepID=A0A8B6X5K5_9BURK|nr:TRAP transporter substrate-binding protein DctP [Derxia gummosa]
MNRHRRALLQGLTAAAALPFVGFEAAAATNLKISHQFPGGTATEGDFRDRLCRRFATELEKRSGGALGATVYPGSSLMKTNAQFSAMRKGALDMSLVPLSYAGGEVPEVNIGLMPGVVTSYEQGTSWKTAEVGKALSDILADKGVILVSWIWQAGGTASRGKALIEPEDAKGMKVRGGSREMDMVLKQAGAAVLSLPSNEIYAAMQTGALDAAMTSSTSLISFRLEEVAKQLTTGRGKTYWFMFEPLMISRSIFEALPKDQQQLVMTVGAEMEKFALDAAKGDDEAVAKVYEKAGGKANDMSAATVAKWQAIARDTAWKDYAAKNDNCARILKLVEKTL